MLFMNIYEIDDKARRYQSHPVLGPATQFLLEFKDMVNENSDGWAYWKAAARSAKKLMELINSPETATMEQFKKSLTPIKSLCTRKNLPCPPIRPFS